MSENPIVRVLGARCSQCRALEEWIRSLAATHQVSIDTEKVSDLQEIMKCDILMTPGLVIGGVLKSYGNTPKDG